jgi:hypothetical protein
MFTPSTPQLIPQLIAPAGRPRYSAAETALKIIFGLQEENLQEQTGPPNNFSLGLAGF